LKEQENKIEALSQENLELKSDLQSLRDEIMKLKNIIGSE
jgi:predicted RNase H-like nuclease (RuvC/YqgF family)